MKKHLYQSIYLFLLFCMIWSISLGQDNQDTDEQAAVGEPVNVECDNDISITDGASIIVNNLVTGLDYAITVIGVNSFDPVLAILDEDGDILECENDARDAANFIADLPSSGFVDAQNRNVQIKFKNEAFSDTRDIQLVIGGVGQTYGEFVIIIEGMAIKQFEDQGDIFSILRTESILKAEVAPTLYAISVTGQLDPVIYFVDSEGNQIFDENQVLIYCDDSGFDDICWGNSVPLTSYYVSRTFNRTLNFFEYDSMLSVDQNRPGDDPYLHYLVGGYLGDTFGDYVVAMHIGIGDPNAVTAEGTEEPDTDSSSG